MKVLVIKTKMLESLNKKNCWLSLTFFSLGQKTSFFFKYVVLDMNVVMGVMNVVNMFWFWIYWRLIFEDGTIIKKPISAQPIKLYHWNLVRILDRPWNLMDYFHFHLRLRNFCLISNIVPGLIFFQLWGFMTGRPQSN